MIVNDSERGPVVKGIKTGGLSVTGEIDQSQLLTQLHLSNGDTLTLPTELLLEKVKRSARPEQVLSDPSTFVPSQALDQQVVPIVEERLDVTKRVVATGALQIVHSSEEYSETVDTPLTSITFEVTRQVINRLVSERPVPREEGETTIYSIVEERVVLATELILKEQVRVTRRETVTNDRQVITLRRDHIDVKRSTTEDAASQLMTPSLDQKAAL